jgi:hypothetical protein
MAGEQSARATHNADYQWLLASLTSLDSAREEKTLSLNLKRRQQQRTAQDLARLTQENTRRGADGLPAWKSVDDISISDEPDVILAQAGDIMADAVASDGNRNAPAVAQQAPVAATADKTGAP